MIELLISNKLMISVNGSYFLAIPELVLAHFILIDGRNKVGLGDFISTIILPFQNFFTVELYRILNIYKLIIYLILKYIITYEELKIEIWSDYVSTLNFLS